MALPKLDSLYNSGNKSLLPNQIETDVPPSPSANELGNMRNDWTNAGGLVRCQVELV